MFIYILLLLPVALSLPDTRFSPVINWYGQSVRTIVPASRQQDLRVPIRKIQGSRQIPARWPQSRTDGSADYANIELACRLKLYELLMKEEWPSALSFSASTDDRVIFLIPLIIIYWYHRHPHAPIPFGDINGLLRRMDDDQARAEQVVLQHMIAVLGTRNRCLDVPSDELDRYLEQMKSRNTKRQSDAILLLNDWISSVDENHALASGDRQSGTRSINALFKAMANMTHRRPAKFFEDRRAPVKSQRGRAREDLGTTTISSTEPPTLRERYENRTAVTAARSRPYLPETTTTLPTTLKPTDDPVSQTTTALAPSSSTTLKSTNLAASMPQSDDTTASTVEISSNSSQGLDATTTSNPIATTELPVELNTARPTHSLPSTTSTDSQIDTTLSSTKNNTAGSLNQTHTYMEIFGLVSSIFNEMDQIYNSSSGEIF